MNLEGKTREQRRRAKQEEKRKRREARRQAKRDGDKKVGVRAFMQRAIPAHWCVNVRIDAGAGSH